MIDIAIVAINARFSHSGLGARYLLANMGELRERACLLEFNINQPVEDIFGLLCSRNPRIVGLGVYIWNRVAVEQLVVLLKARLPDARIVLGGPEISHDTGSGLAQGVDCVICGEAEKVWPEVCRKMLQGETVDRVRYAPPPDTDSIVLPYDDYSADDLNTRNVYVESSRGCPYACDFCLSSAMPGVRYFPEERIFAELQQLFARGARQLRFVDRSFNLGGRRAERLLEFLLKNGPEGMRLHFEMTPDGLGQPLRNLLAAFPAGSLHIETGIQSFDRTTLQRVNRECDPDKTAEGIQWLVRDAAIDVHADLIAGLPGETPQMFEKGFDRLYGLGATEIQVGILKMLHGTRLQQIAPDYGMVFNKQPPYEIIETAAMSADYLQSVRRFAAHWERIVNRGHYRKSVERMLQDASSPWARFNRFSIRLAGAHGLHGIGLVEAAGVLYSYLTEECSVPPAEARALLRVDYLAGGRRMHLPAFLRD